LDCIGFCLLYIGFNNAGSYLMDKLSKILLGSYAFILLIIGFYFLFKPDLSSTIYPFLINDIETSAQLRAVFGGSLVAFGYLLIRFLSSSSNVTVSSVLIYIVICINFGRFISLFYEGFLSFTLISWAAELLLLILLWIAHKNRKNKIDYYM